MLRQLLIFGICAGTSASIPIIYQANSSIFASMFDRRETVEVVPPREQINTLTPRSAPAPLGRKVALPPDVRGHFSGEFQLNGRRVTAMVDTGATVVALNASTARRIGISLTPADFRLEVDTANGRARAANVVIDEMKIGRIAVNGVQAVVLDDAALDGALIGMSFLRKLGKYQVDGGVLTLTQ